MGDLQPTDERCSGNVFIAFVHQRYPALEVADVVFQALPWFHFYHEEIVVILLKLSPGSELIIEGVSYVFEASEGVLWE